MKNNLTNQLTNYVNVINKFIKYTMKPLNRKIHLVKNYYYQKMSIPGNHAFSTDRFSIVDNAI